MKRALCGVVALSLALTGRAQADYTFTQIDVPGSDGTLAFGINDSGQIVGYYQDADGYFHGFLATPQ